MAQFRLSVSIASRGKGRSAVAMAAYRSGEAILDERTGERFDFTRKGGIVSRDMVLPDGAPPWAQERASFWNRSEAADKRADAQIAREIQISLPHELSDRERRELTTGFSQHIAERFGIAVDTCIHRPHEKGDERNHHAHLLLATRPFDDEKQTGLGNKVRALDNIAHQRQGHSQEQKSENEVEQLRQVWAQRVNEALQRAEVHTPEGVSVQVDHRSYERQGIDQEPTVKEGLAATGLKRRGLPSERGQLNAEIRQRNAQRDELKDLIGGAARELSELKKSIEEDREAPSTSVSGTDMTDIQKQEQLEKDARIADFRARFAEQMKRFQKADEQQKIGRDYDFQFVVDGDLLEQRNEKEQRIDREFGEDLHDLNRQNSDEKVSFDDWISEQRDRMRSEDAARNPRTIEPRHTPGFAQIPGGAQSRLVTQFDPDFGPKEALRSQAADEMRQEFRDFQKQRHSDRVDKLFERNDLNLEQVGEVYKRESQRQQMEALLTQRQAIQRTAGDLRRDLPPPQEQTPPEQDNLKPKKGESMEDARDRAARMEKARLARIEQEEKDKRDPNRKPKDPWTR